METRPSLQPSISGWPPYNPSFFSCVASRWLSQTQKVAPEHTAASFAQWRNGRYVPMLLCGRKRADWKSVHKVSHLLTLPACCLVPSRLAHHWKYPPADAGDEAYYSIDSKPMSPTEVQLKVGWGKWKRNLPFWVSRLIPVSAICWQWLAARQQRDIQHNRRHNYWTTSETSELPWNK